MKRVQSFIPTSGVRPVRSFLRSIRCAFTVKEKDDLPQQQRWTILDHTVAIGSSSGTKRTGSRCVKVVTPRRPLMKMVALEILPNLRGGRGSESLQKAPNDNALGSSVRNRENHKGGISRTLGALISSGYFHETCMNTRS